MPRLGPRVGPIGVALTAWDLWRRIPPKHRKRILAAARKHGPTIASRLAAEFDAAQRRRRGRR